MTPIVPYLRVALVVFNIIFFVLGVCSISFGLVLVIGSKTVDDRIDNTLSPIRESVRNNYGDNVANQITADGLDLNKVYTTGIRFFIISGSLLLGLSLKGLTGVISKVGTVLVIYACVLIVIILAQTVFITLLFGDPDLFKKGLMKRLDDNMVDFQSLYSTNFESISWNYIMQRFSCCGVDGYQDFSKSQWLLKNDHLTPWACCNDLPNNATEADTCAGASNTSLTSTIDGKNSYDKGCVDEMWTQIVLDNRVYIALISALLFLLQIVLVIFSCVIAADQSSKTAPDNRPGNKPHNRQPQIPHW